MRSISLLIIVFVHFSCERAEDKSSVDMFYFELIDTLQIDLMYEFGFVTKSAIDGYMLAYTYQDGVFHLINKSGEVEYTIDKRGEGPGEYSNNLPFATIFDGELVFMDVNKLSFYKFNGEWINSIPYENLNGVGQRGIPDSDIFFHRNGRFVVPNQAVVDLPSTSSHFEMLDEYSFWIEYGYSEASGQYEISDVGLMDTTGILYSKLKYPNYKTITWFQNELLYQIPQISSTLYQYRVDGSLYPYDKISLKVPDFKEPVGLEVELRTVDNSHLFNKYSAVNSFVNYVVPMENGGFFAIYSTGVSEFKYDNLVEDVKFPEGDFFGFYYNSDQAKGYRILLPENDIHPSFWKHISYFGDGKFMFVFENEIERDYHLAGVFSLKVTKGLV